MKLIQGYSNKLLNHIIEQMVWFVVLVFVCITFMPPLSPVVGAAPPPEDDLHSLDYDSVHHKTYDCGGGSASGLPELEGHKLPAAKGGAGFEEPINESGAVPSTGQKVTFSGFASLGQEYRDFYITMRWRYASWAWNGTSQSGPEDAGWYREKPRLVLVTNPATGKSIVAAILESGPAPWTGTPGGKGDGQQQALWGGYRDDTPEGYLGRVAGFPPAAVEALGMEQWMHGGPSAGGSGHELTYAWASNQDAKPGPTNESAGGGSAGCAGGANGFVFPLTTTKAEMTSQNGGQLKDGKMSEGGHPYAAHDIMANPDTPVVASLGGTVTHIGADKCPGRLVSVYNEENDVVISYLHMNMNTLVSEGQAVQAGEQIGVVGPPGAGCGVPHLHIDAAAGHDRPGCKRENCPSANQAIFRQGSDKIQLPQKLFESYEALP